MKTTLAVMLGLMLAGCAAPAVFDKRACPVERTYTKAEQAQLGRDMQDTPASIQGAMVDYGKLRDKSRACRSAR